MIIPFTKMNGAGNDFVVIDNRDQSLSLSREQIQFLCNRHRGIGADGLLAVEPTRTEADFRFRYYNADGGEAEMCGNGARCFGRYTAELMPNGTDEVSFDTVAGILSAKIVEEDVEVAMSPPTDLTPELKIEIDGISNPIHAVNTGVPHTVTFVDNLAAVDVVKLGAEIRNHSHFAPAGTNANFAQVLTPDHIAIRTYERGVEDETLACGTGMVACALYHHLITGAPSPIKVDVQGGETLSIGFEKEGDDFKNVTLLGPAAITFTGEIDLA
jgi:diaminopimelate epimerase